MSGDVVHRLGTLAGIAAVLVGASAWWHRLRCERRTRRRLDAFAARERRRTGARLPLLRAVGGRLPYVAVVGAGWVTVGGLGGVGLGTVLAVGLWQWHRRQRRAAAEASASDTALDTALAARQLPLAADLLSACITAGAGPVPAAQAVGETLGGPVGDALARGAAEVRLGGEPGRPGAGWPPCQARFRWRGCWSGPMCPASRWPRRWAGSPPRRGRSGPARRPRGPGGRRC